MKLFDYHPSLDSVESFDGDMGDIKQEYVTKSYRLAKREKIAQLLERQEEIDRLITEAGKAEEADVYNRGVF